MAQRLPPRKGRWPLVYVQRDRLPTHVPFVALGIACVIAGGSVSAAIAPAPTEHGAWASAYLVLVAGMAQITLGIAQATLIPQFASRRVVVAQLVGWNAGNAAVLTGTLLDVGALVDLGGALLVGVLVGLALRSRTATCTGAPNGIPRDRKGVRLLYVFRALLVLLVVSVPIGLVLQHIRPA